MDLHDASSFFDDTVVTVPGSPRLLFMGQLELFADQQRDGLSTERRILSYDPCQNFTLPQPAIVRFANRNWALGLTSPDDFQGSVVRAAYIAQLCDSQYDLGSAAEFIAAAPRATSWCGLVWDKEAKDGDGTENVWSQVTLYTGLGHTAVEGDFARCNGKLWRLRNVYVTSSNLSALEAIELPVDALQTITWTPAAYDRIHNQRGAGAPVQVPAIVMPYYQQWRVVTQSQVKPKDGDLVVRVLATNTVAVGDQLIVGGSVYNVAVIRPMADATLWLHGTV